MESLGPSCMDSEFQELANSQHSQHGAMLLKKEDHRMLMAYPKPSASVSIAAPRRVGRPSAPKRTSQSWLGIVLLGIVHSNTSDGDHACVVTPTRLSGGVFGLHSTIRDVSSQRPSTCRAAACPTLGRRTYETDSDHHSTPSTSEFQSHG